MGDQWGVPGPSVQGCLRLCCAAVSCCYAVLHCCVMLLCCAVLCQPFGKSDAPHPPIPQLVYMCSCCVVDLPCMHVLWMCPVLQAHARIICTGVIHSQHSELVQWTTLAVDNHVHCMRCGDHQQTGASEGTLVLTGASGGGTSNAVALVILYWSYCTGHTVLVILHLQRQTWSEQCTTCTE